MGYWYYEQNSKPLTWESILTAIIIIAGISLLAYVSGKLIDKFL